MDKKSHMCVKLIRSAHTNQKRHQKVSDQAEAKGWMRTAWGSIKGCSARQQLKPKWSCLEHHQNVSLRENIFSLLLVFSLHIPWKIPDISWRTCVWLPSGFHYYILFAFSDTWSWKQNFSWLKSERLNKGESWLLLLCFVLFMYFLQLMHLKNSILCLVPNWQCLWGWEQEILPRQEILPSLHRKD